MLGRNKYIPESRARRHGVHYTMAEAHPSSETKVDEERLTEAEIAVHWKEVEYF